MEAHWADAGVAERLNTERFRSTLVTEGKRGTVTFLHQGAVVEPMAPRPFSTPARTPVSAAVGCRMGICFRCAVPLRQGMVRDLRDGQLTTPAEGDSIHIQTCVSAAAGRCEIDV